MAFVIPCLQIQLTGLGIIVRVASFDRIDRSTAMIIGVILVASFVFVGGLRAVAWVSVLKDFLMIFAALSIGITAHHLYFGGIGPMFKALAQAKPAYLTMPGGTPNMGHSWCIPTVLLSSLGFYMWPHAFGAAFTARSGDILRRNAIVMPLYTLSLAFIFSAGFAAVLVVPGLSNGDLSALTLVRKAFPAWFLGVIGYAGVTQFFPGVVLGIFWERVTTPGVFSGILIGVTIAAFLMLSKHDPFLGLNAGFLALCAKFAVTVLVSLVKPLQANGFDTQL